MSKTNLIYKGVELYVADSYDNYKPYGEPIEENGKLYQTMFTTCSRCGGTGWTPLPNYTCFRCNGNKYETQKVRLYDAKEYNTYKKQSEAAAAKRKQQAELRHQKMKAEFKIKHGFNDNDFTYLYYGDTYSIKDMLKENGAVFDYILGWHSPQQIDLTSAPSNVYSLTLAFDTVYTLDEEVDAYCLLPDARETIEQITKIADEEFSNSEYVGEEKQKIEVNVTISSIAGYSNKFGDGHMYIFNSNGNKLVWFTSSNPDINVDEEYTITATVKKHEEYKGTKQTIVTRVKVI